MKSSESDVNDQENLLLCKQNNVRTKILKNKLKILTILNIITFFVFIVAMVVDHWVKITIKFKKNFIDYTQVTFWANLLYMREDYQDSPYQTFEDAGKRICGHNMYCLAIFQEMKYLGNVCFATIAVAGFLQLFDFIRMLFFIKDQKKLIENTHYFRHIVTIITYFIGITLSAFGIIVIHPEAYDFGFCFWIAVSTLVMFISLLVYEQFSLQRIKKQALIRRLLQQEKEINRNELMNDSSSLDDDSKNERSEKIIKRESQGFTL